MLLASPVGLFLMVGWLVLRRVKESRFVGRLTRRGWAWWLQSLSLLTFEASSHPYVM